MSWQFPRMPYGLSFFVDFVPIGLGHLSLFCPVLYISKTNWDFFLRLCIVLSWFIAIKTTTQIVSKSQNHLSLNPILPPTHWFSPIPPLRSRLSPCVILVWFMRYSCAIHVQSMYSPYSIHDFFLYSTCTLILLFISYLCFLSNQPWHDFCILLI